MYEDEDFWPIKCFQCKEEFVEKIGRIKAGEETRCPNCGIRYTHPTEQFLLALAEAKQGRHDPWRDMLRLNNPPKSV